MGTRKGWCAVCRKPVEFFSVREDFVVCPICHIPVWVCVDPRPEPSEAERAHLAIRTGLLEEMMD